MKLYQCAECEESKERRRFEKGVLDDDPLFWVCRKCSNEIERYVMSPEVQAEIARQVEKPD